MHVFEKNAVPLHSLLSYRDVAQLVAHYVRDVGVGRSSRLIPTEGEEWSTPLFAFFRIQITAIPSAPAQLQAPSRVAPTASPYSPLASIHAQLISAWPAAVGWTPSHTQWDGLTDGWPRTASSMAQQQDMRHGNATTGRKPTGTRPMQEDRDGKESKLRQTLC